MGGWLWVGGGSEGGGGLSWYYYNTYVVIVFVKEKLLVQAVQFHFLHFLLLAM